MSAPASLLAQVSPGTTGAVTAFVATLRTEIKRIVVCKTNSDSGAYSIYHDDDGTTYNASTALYLNKTLAGSTTDLIDAHDEGAGISLSPGGSLGVQSASASAMTFSIYGVTQVGR